MNQLTHQDRAQVKCVNRAGVFSSVIETGVQVDVQSGPLRGHWGRTLDLMEREPPGIAWIRVVYFRTELSRLRHPSSSKVRVKSRLGNLKSAPVR